MKLSERLKTERIAQGFTQKTLAKKSHCSQVTISDIERGRNSGSKELPSIAKALNVSIYWLADGVSPKYVTPVIANQVREEEKIYGNNPVHQPTPLRPYPALIDELIVIAGTMSRRGQIELIGQAKLLAAQHPRINENNAM